MGLAAVFTVISGGLRAVGAIQQARAEAAAFEYNAAIDARNRQIADQDRRYNVQLAEVEADDKRRENARTMSSIRTAYGSSGLDLGGTPLDVLEDTALELNLDVRRIEQEGRVRNREGGIKMQEFGERSVLNKMRAKSARTAGAISAFGYLADTGAKVASMAGDSLARTG